MLYQSMMKIKIRTYGDKVYTYFRGLNVPEDDIECEFFTVISILVTIFLKLMKIE